jgi:hypothetical protein
MRTLGVTVAEGRSGDIPAAMRRRTLVSVDGAVTRQPRPAHAPRRRWPSYWPPRATLGGATEPTRTGHLFTIRCLCGVVARRYVTLEEAAIDVAALARRN